MKKYEIRLKLFIFDFINGIRSNIPLCCVWFFCKRVFHGERCIGRNVYLERKPNGNFGTDLSGTNYVRCDKCYYNNKVADVNFTNGTILKKLTEERILLK